MISGVFKLTFLRSSRQNETIGSSSSSHYPFQEETASAKRRTLTHLHMFCLLLRTIHSFLSQKLRCCRRRGGRCYCLGRPCPVAVAFVVLNLAQHRRHRKNDTEEEGTILSAEWPSKAHFSYPSFLLHPNSTSSWEKAATKLRGNSPYDC